MKKLHVFFFILLIASGLVFAEDVKVKTGDVFGASMTDYFTPVAKGIRGSWTCVSSIKNVEKDLWCLTLVVDSKSNQIDRKVLNKAHKSGVPIVIECMIDKDEPVLPMLKPNGSTEDILTSM